MRLALAFTILLTASPALAAEVRCWRAAGSETRCDDGTRAHEFRGAVTVERNGVVTRRCWRTAGGELWCEGR